MITEDTMRLILDLPGKEAVPLLTSEVKTLEAELETLTTKWKNNEIALGTFANEAGQLQNQLGQTKNLLNSLTGAPGSGGNPGQGILGASYAFQDFTSVLAGGQGFGRALGAVQNNIPMLISSLGGTAGVAGAVSVVAVAIGILIDNWGKLQKAWSTESTTKSEADAMKELEENTKRTADETQRLAKYKKEHAETEKIIHSQATKEGEQTASWEGFFAESGGGKLQGQIAGALGATGRGAGMTEEESAEISGLEAGVNKSKKFNLHAQAADYQARLDAARSKAQERINALNMAKAGKLLGQAPTDKGARATIGALAKAVPGAFPRDFAAEMAGNEPEALEAEDEKARAFDEGNEAWREQKRKRRIADLKQHHRDLAKTNARETVQARIKRDVQQKNQAAQQASQRNAQIQGDRTKDDRDENARLRQNTQRQIREEGGRKQGFEGEKPETLHDQMEGIKDQLKQAKDMKEQKIRALQNQINAEAAANEGQMTQHIGMLMEQLNYLKGIGKNVGKQFDRSAQSNGTF